MKKLLFFLAITMVFTFAGCNHEQNYILEPSFFTVENEELLLNNSDDLENIPESLEIYWEAYFIEDYQVGDDCHYITYFDKVNDQEVWIIAGFDSTFELMWKVEFLTEHGLNLISVNRDYVVVQSCSDDFKEEQYFVYSHTGELLHLIESERNIKWIESVFFTLQ